MIQNFNHMMGESGCSLTVLDVVDALQMKYALMSGGKTEAGSPIVTFPDDKDLPEISDVTYRDVITYLGSIPSLQEVDVGFVVVVDRRHDKWGTSIRTLLLRISGYFPGLVQEVIVLRPNGFLQRTFSNIGSKLGQKEEFKFKVAVCTSLDELHSLIDPSQLTSDLGGCIDYDHSVWIQHRAAIEKFSANTTQTGHTLQELCGRLQQTQFPNDVSATEELIGQTKVTEGEIAEDLTSTIKHGEVLLRCFRTITLEDKSEVELESSALSPSRQLHITAVERLLVQLEETAQNFRQFWSNHERKLQQCLQLRQFEDEFKQLVSRVTEHIDSVEVMLETGDSLQRVQTLLMELQQLDDCAQVDVSSAEDLESRGRHLMEQDHYAVDCIRPKCLELQRMVLQYRDMVRSRNQLLLRSQQLQTNIDSAHRWCIHGTELLANQQIEPGNQLTWAHDALVDIERFLSLSDQLMFSHSKEVNSVLSGEYSEGEKECVRSIQNRINEVRAMCERRRSSLVKLFEKPVRPVQTVVPAVSADRKRRYFNRRSGSEANLTDKTKLNVELSWPDQNTSPVSNSEYHSDSEKTDFSEYDTIGAKRRHVMKELILTERLYVDELGSVLRGYASEMDNLDMLHLMPEDLRGKKNVLFGNMQQIYNFHNNVFLKELEACRETPSLVGTCFVRRKEEFQMYSTYCQNKPLAERLRRDVGDNNPFFKECKRQLNHKLPLGAYLLKPVQRITKYQLLLKEMLRHTDNEAGCEVLEVAVATMLDVLKYVNDIMHQVAITGYHGELTDLGRLLMQGPFSIWTAHKKLRELRFKPMQRHLFLYEHKLLFCKHHEVAQNADKASYVFKNSLETSRLGLTEGVKGDHKKFELWLHGRTEVYVILAASIAIKDAWIAEIKKMLQTQFDSVRKATSLTSLTHELSLTPDPLHESNKLSQRCSSVRHQQRRMSTRGVGHDDSLGSTDYDETGWSSDESDDYDTNCAPPVAAPRYIADFVQQYQDLEPQQYVSLADYTPCDAGEITLHEGDHVDLLKIGSEGWWLVRCTATSEEGWAPSTYLESSKRSSTYSTVSTASTESSGKVPMELLEMCI